VKLAVLHRNLVYSILTVASVPCIIIKNEAGQTYVNDYLAVLASCAVAFDSIIERVYFLYQDKAYRRGQSVQSSELTKWVNSLNSQYFEGREVIQVLCKPNFSCAAHQQMSEDFLTDFFAAALHFPKKSRSGSFTLTELLTIAQYAAESPDTSLETLAISEGERSECRFYLENHNKAIHSHFDRITGPDQITQLRTFVKSLYCDLERVRLADKQVRYLSVAMKLQETEYFLSLSAIEARFNELNRMSEQGRVELVQSLISTYYEKSILYTTYVQRVKGLKGKLKEVKKRYPSLRLNTAIETVTKEASERFWTRAWVTARSVLRFGFTPIWTDTHSRSIIQRTEMIGDKADVLFSIVDTRNVKGITWCSERLSGVCEVDIPKLLLVVVAWDQLPAADLANALLYQLLPFAIEDATPFSSNSSSQFFAFKYPGKEALGVVILLTSPLPAVSYRAQTIRAVATHFCRTASLVCLLDGTDARLGLELLQEQAEIATKARIVMWLWGDRRVSCAAALQAKMVEDRANGTVHIMTGAWSQEMPTIQARMLENLQSARLIAAKEFREIVRQTQEIVISE